MKKYSKCIMFLLVILLGLGITDCGKKNSGKEVTYTQLSFNTIKTLCKTKELLRLAYGLKQGNKVIVIAKEVWLVDLETGKDEKLFIPGFGPNELPDPGPADLYNGNVYIKSWLPIPFLFSVSIAEAQKKQLNTLKFSTKESIAFDDFVFISKDTIAFTSPYWKEGFLQFYDFSKKTLLPTKLGKATFTKLMNNFNLNIIRVCRLNERVYAAESIVPAIQVFDVKQMTHVETIPLSPPFFVPYTAFPPPNIPHFDNAPLINEWTNKWTAIFDITAKNGWLLVKYRFGIQERYCYELVNADSPWKRYYFAESPNSIFDFNVTGKHMEFFATTEMEESLDWKKCEIELP